jgi:hypothetical protein
MLSFIILNANNYKRMKGEKMNENYTYGSN